MQLSARTGRTQLNLIHCRFERFHRQSSVKVLLVQHVNCTASDLVTLSPVNNDLDRRLVLSCSVVQNCQVDICQAVDGVAVSLYISTLCTDAPWTVQSLSAAQCCVSYSLRLSSTWRLDLATIHCCVVHSDHRLYMIFSSVCRRA